MDFRLRKIVFFLGAIALLSFGCRDPNIGERDAGDTPDAVSADAAPPGVCDPYEARPLIPEVYIGPVGLEDRLLSYINSAQEELWVMMYLITQDKFSENPWKVNN